jgi:hypothetical protein
MTGKRWFAAVCTALVITALAARPAHATEPPRLVVYPLDGFMTMVGSSQDVRVLLSNASGVPLRIEGIDLVTGPAATGVFTLDGPSTCPAEGQLMDAWTTCRFTVRFTPRSVSTVHATLQARGTMMPPGQKEGAALNSDEIELQGGAGSLSVPAEQEFGQVPVGLLGGATTVTLRDAASVSIVRTSLSGANAGDFVLASNGCDGSVVGTCDIRLRFAPSGLGERTATVTLETLPYHVYTIALRGEGVPLPAGPKGDPGQPGAAGREGARGPEGPRGPAGQVTCRNTAAARLLCDALFAPGTWKPAGSATAARFTLSRGGRVYARGRATVNRHGRVRMRVRKVRKGTYMLKLRVGHGPHAVVLRRVTRIR